MRYVLVPVPREYVLDVMRWVLANAPDEQAEGSGRSLARVVALVGKLDEFEQSVLALVAKSVWGDDSLTLRDAADEFEQPAQRVAEAVAAINRKAMWGREVVTLRSEAVVGFHGQRGRASVLTMSPETARLVRTATRSSDVPSA